VGALAADSAAEAASKRVMEWGVVEESAPSAGGWGVELPSGRAISMIGVGSVMDLPLVILPEGSESGPHMPVMEWVIPMDSGNTDTKARHNGF
jgi:hypothetical protein